MFETFQSDKNQKYYFNLKAGNGQIILSSQGYADAKGRANGIESVKKNSTDESRYERKTTANDKHHFVLKAGNNQVVGTSQMYASTDGMENGIKSVMTNAGKAEVKERA